MKRTGSTTRALAPPGRGAAQSPPRRGGLAHGTSPRGIARLTAAGMLAASLISSFHARAMAATPFVHETVDAGGNVGLYTSLAIDAAGNPHVSYYYSTGGDLKYASKVGGTWLIETVDTPGTVGQYSSLALDGSGNPHISYYDATNGDLKYATKAAGYWIVETVDATNTVGLYTSIAVAADGRPRISYYYSTAGDLKYASKASGAWALEVVDAGGTVGQYTSLALAADGSARIAYYDVSNGELKYASNGNLTWAIQTVTTPSADAVGLYTSIALDGQANPNISYQNATTDDLYFASRSSGAWVTELVDGTGVVGLYTSLALDSQGNPRISYFDDTNNDLKYASKSGSTWTVETVDAPPGVTVGQYTSLALDPQGNPHISHYDAINLDLRFTDAGVHLRSPVGGERWAAGSRQTVRWEGSGTVSLQLSSDGGSTYTTLLSNLSGNAVEITVPTVTTDQARVRISRSSPASTSDSPGFFSIAPDLVSPWWTKPVDRTGNVFDFSSLALDSHGNPRISYRDFTAQDLKYAAKAGGVWTLETVDATGGADIGRSSSLALDAQGNPAIAYRDDTNGLVKYATKIGGTWTLENADASGNMGNSVSLGLDAAGNPRIAFRDETNNVLKYATKSGGSWRIETVDEPGSVGSLPSIAVTEQGEPRISYLDDANNELKYAARWGTTWAIETVSRSAATLSPDATLRLDAQGNPRISYHDDTATHDLMYASGAIEVVEPSPGVIWPVGARRRLSWDGSGRVDFYLSSDGGLSWELRESGLSGGEYRLIVPHAPSRFCKVRLVRSVPRSYAESDERFTIEASVSLLSFSVELAPTGEAGARLSWQSEPGPAELAGYKLERAGLEERWRTVVALTRETTYRDESGTPGMRYRLSAVNGLGGEQVLGEAALPAALPLAAGPLPYRGGDLVIRFATGGGAGEAELGLYDLGGRPVRRLAQGRYPAGLQQVRWDGRDSGGQPVPPGVYFLRARSAGEEHRMKVVVMR